MKGLVLVDIPGDFLPSGALGVFNGDAVIPVANELLPAFPLVLATQDWHPANQGSFAATHPGRKPFEKAELDGLPQTLWPVHCVHDTPGAAFASALDQSRITRVSQKGTDPRIDSYSGFFDNRHRKSTGMGEWLKSKGATEVFVCGLATDYCVKFTVLDALRFGFKPSVVEDASRGVNLNPTDTQNTLRELKEAGVRLVQSGDLKREFGSPPA